MRGIVHFGKGRTEGGPTPDHEAHATLARPLRHRRPADARALSRANLLDYLSEHARDHGHDPGIVFEGKRISWAELDRLSNAFAAALSELGVGAGDRVALILPNCPQFLIAEFGAWKLGALVAPLNPIYTEQELATLLASSGAKVAVVLTATRATEVVSAEHGGETVIATTSRSIQALTRLLFTAFKEKEEGDRVELRDGDLAFAELLHRDEVSRPTTHAKPEDDATILPSGGTTGIPKGVVGSHRNMVLAGLQLHAWLHSALQDGRDVLMVPLPLFHVYGLIGVQSLSIVARMPMLLVANPRDMKGMLHAIAHEKPSFFCTVPALLNAMLNHPSVLSGKASFSSLKICFSGGAPLMGETIRRYQELTGGRLIEGYSLTEAQMAAIANPVRGPNKVGSIGMPLPDVDIRIVGSEEGASEIRMERLRRADHPGAAAHARLLEQRCRDAAGDAGRPRWGHVALYRRSRIPRRGWLRLSRRPQEGSDQSERLSGVAARDRGSSVDASVRVGGRRGRDARRDEGRGSKAGGGEGGATPA